MTEKELEQQCIDWFKEIGWNYHCGYDIAPDTDDPKRIDYKQVALEEYLSKSLERINPNIPKENINEIITKLTRLDASSVEFNNRQFHRFINNGIPIEIRTDEGIRSDIVKIIDFENLHNNHFLVVNQFTIQGNNGNRRPDLVVLSMVCLLPLLN